MKWNRIPDGSRVKHRDQGYEGWIDGLTEKTKAGKLNPDGKTQYRIRVFNALRRELAAEQEIEVCKDLENVFRSTTTLLQTKIEQHSKDKKENERLAEWSDLFPLPCNIWALGEYLPERDQKGNYLRNRGNHTQHILNLKKVAHPSAIDYFVERLDEILAEGFPICMIPSSDPSKNTPGLRQVIGRLAQNNRIDGSSLLIRRKLIPASQSASYYKTDRENIHMHLESMKVVDSSLIRSRLVLLLDDIVTTGTSFMACRKLLLDAGASEAVCLALGKTRRVKGSN